jgi:hypothetical protein
LGSLRSFWIEFGDWPRAIRFRRLPVYPREAGVTALDERDALDLIRRAFYEPDRNPPSIRRVVPDVTVAQRRLAGPHDLLEEASGMRGIWYPKPFFPDRTVVDPGPRRTPYEAIAMSALEEYEMPARVAKSRTVIVERIAYGAGSTNWWLLESPPDVSLLASRAAPGSSLSLYPESRWSEVAIDAEVRATILSMVRQNEEAFVARRLEGIELAGAYVMSAEDLDDLLVDQLGGHPLIFGTSSLIDDESVLTVYLPDRDGTTRRHPY